MLAEVNGTRLCYAIEGSGPALLLIHGIGGSGLDWGGVLPRLAAACMVLTVDMRGFGRSDKPDGPCSAALWAADIAALLRQIGVAPAFVVGHSMGGVVAQRLLLDFPELLQAAVLVSTSSEVNEAAAQYWESQAAEIEREGIGPMVARRQATYTDEFRAAHPEALASDGRRLQFNKPRAHAAGARAVARYNFTAELRGVAKPVLIVQGLDDKQTPPGGSVIMSRAIPGARLEMLENCGHNVMYDQPEAFVALTLGFVRDQVAALPATGG